MTPKSNYLSSMNKENWISEKEGNSDLIEFYKKEGGLGNELSL